MNGPEPRSENTPPQDPTGREDLPEANAFAAAPSSVQASRVERDRLMFNAGFAAANARIDARTIANDERVGQTSGAASEPVRVAKRGASTRREAGDWAQGFWTAAAFVATSTATAFVTWSMWHTPNRDGMSPVNLPVVPARLPGVDTHDSEGRDSDAGDAAVRDRTGSDPRDGDALSTQGQAQVRASLSPPASGASRNAAAARRRQLERSLDIERNAGGVGLWADDEPAASPDTPSP